jgi:hypothetical protein
MNPYEVLLLAYLIGLIAGLRTMTAPAVIAWAANRTHATRSHWSDSHRAGSDPEENLCLAHRFLGKKVSGWHYDLMLVLMNVVIACTGGGKYVLWK